MRPMLFWVFFCMSLSVVLGSEWCPNSFNYCNDYCCNNGVREYCCPNCELTRPRRCPMVTTSPSWDSTVTTVYISTWAIIGIVFGVMALSGIGVGIYLCTCYESPTRRVGQVVATRNNATIVTSTNSTAVAPPQAYNPNAPPPPYPTVAQHPQAYVGPAATPYPATGAYPPYPTQPGYGMPPPAYDGYKGQPH